jgi:hypothetical protein
MPRRDYLLTALSEACSDLDLEALLAQVQVATPTTYTLPSPLTDESTEDEAAEFQETMIRHTMRVAAGDLEALLAEHNNALAAYREKVANLALSKKDPFDAQMLAYNRGFFAGVDHCLVRSPARAKALLEQGVVQPDQARSPAWRES